MSANDVLKFVKDKEAELAAKIEEAKQFFKYKIGNA